mmetsp:Transcript_11150/g.19516  ORF Transcript_11150/g.19516 Transcript_11150/m.19516 type:complete len:95 (+) Transcript_11150:131-415(+)
MVPFPTPEGPHRTSGAKESGAFLLKKPVTVSQPNDGLGSQLTKTLSFLLPANCARAAPPTARKGAAVVHALGNVLMAIRNILPQQSTSSVGNYV